MITDVTEETRTGANSWAARALSVEDAARQLGVGRTITYGLIKNGALRSLKVGSRRLVPIGAIDEFIYERSHGVDAEFGPQKKGTPDEESPSGPRGRKK